MAWPLAEKVIAAGQPVQLACRDVKNKTSGQHY
jgi:hypothetical protein